jgi:hypothetical protein
MANEHASATHKAVYTVTEGKDGKSFWCRIGVAFENRDGSINIFLDALPVNGKLQVREFEDSAANEDHGADEHPAADEAHRG